MKTYTYSVKFSVDRKPGYEVTVEARDGLSAERMAMAEIQGRAGYAGKKIKITGKRKI